MQFDSYVGLPFASGGRCFDGVDCWGLVWLFFAHERGVRLRSYAEAYEDASDYQRTSSLISGGLDDWQEADPKPGTVALILRGRKPSHVGIVAPGRRLLHIEHSDGLSCIAPITASMRRRIVGYYRPKVIA